jgi:hypothetical protein
VPPGSIWRGTARTAIGRRDGRRGRRSALAAISTSLCSTEGAPSGRDQAGARAGSEHFGQTLGRRPAGGCANADPAMTRAHARSSITGRLRRRNARRTDAGLLIGCQRRVGSGCRTFARVSAPLAASVQYAIPRPAVIRFIAPGVISGALPSLSRC